MNSHHATTPGNLPDSLAGKPASESRVLGLVTGLGVGAGMFYYKALVERHLALGFTPRLLMIHADVRRVMKLASAGETRHLALYFQGMLNRMARGGAEVASIPAFSPQVCAVELLKLTPIPLINILDVILDEVRRRNLRRVTVFGARVTIETQMFGQLKGLEVINPTPEEIDAISARYLHIVEAGHSSDEDYRTLRSIAHTVVEREKVDAIILAGTDLAFVFNPGNADFPHLDGARLHIDAIMKIITETPV